MTKKLVVFPNDSLLDYYKKGEIKERYFNPKNWFDEIHVISLFDHEIESDKVKQLAGSGKLIIHKIEKVNLSNYKSFENKIVSLISKIKPLVIRSFNPRVQGWLATKASKRLQIPIIISLHTNYDQQKELVKKERKYFKFLKYYYSSQTLEKYVLQNSDCVICVYEFIIPYAKKMKAKNIEIIYNKVDLTKFSNSNTIKSNPPTIISVGRLISQKTRYNIIRSVQNLDVKLIIIGNGPDYEKYNELIQSLNISEKVKMIKQVPNAELANYYTSSDIFALEMENLGGIPIPFLEAMASGLPVVTTKHSDTCSEITDNAIVFVENTPESFGFEFQKILSNVEYRKDLQKKSLDIIKKIDGKKMEEKELAVYKKLAKCS